MANYELSANYGYDLQIKYIRGRMKEKKVTLKKLSETIGLNASTLNRNFKDRTMSHITFLKICGVLEINPYLIPKEANNDYMNRINFN